jgi:hypothetical protein
MDELQLAVVEQGAISWSFPIEGVVCALGKDRHLLALQNKTATILIRVPDSDTPIYPGEHVTLVGFICSVTRTQFGLQISSLVVDNDQRHSTLLKIGRLYLEYGFQPMRLECFNGWADSVLKLEYAGSQVSRQNVPANLFWRAPSVGQKTTDLVHGLDFSAYNGDWLALPNFSCLTPVTNGIATNPSLAYSVKKGHTPLAFTGFMMIANSVIHTFYLTSDAGRRLEIGQPSFSLSRERYASLRVPFTETVDRALGDRDRDHWHQLNGEVVFVGESEGNLQIDLVDQENHLPVVILGGEFRSRPVKVTSAGFLWLVGISNPAFAKNLRANMIACYVPNGAVMNHKLTEAVLRANRFLFHMVFEKLESFPESRMVAGY